MGRQSVSALDEKRQVPQSAVFHDQMNVGGGFMAVDEGHDVRMMEALQNVDLGGKVVFQLLVELGQVDRLDGYVRAGFLVGLKGRSASSSDVRLKTIDHSPCEHPDRQ